MRSVQKLTIKEWALPDRPREKLMLHGRRALSDAELLAILIGSGSRNETAVDLCKRLLHQMDDDLEKLGALSVADLCRYKGIGEAKALTIISALELCYRRSSNKQREAKKISCSKDSFNLMQRYFAGLKQEEFWIILLNRASKLISTEQVSKGSTGETLVDPKLILPLALDNHASFMVMCHNHPSGNVNPSEEDIKLTRRLNAASAMLGITIADHLIFAGNSYYSFADAGLI